MIEIKQKAAELTKRVSDIEESLNLEALREKLNEYDKEMSNPDFWSDQSRAKELTSLRKETEETINTLTDIKNRVKDINEFIDLSNLENPDEAQLINDELEKLEKDIEKLELKTFLNEEFDKNNAYLTIQAGAGGTEACDWADMLFRMYKRWAEKHGFDIELLELNPDDVAGIKSATLLIKGPYAYGYLKGETGVHRLVRISPFDANARRHTSFASVWVTPEIGDKINIEIREEDIKMDTFRASGAGGQYVNKTDSAVRLTHIPTGITVSCQQERSQLQNRLKALEMLKAKLYQLEMQKLEEKKKSLEGSKTDIGWGHQIRSYVFQPYQIVKDLRTGVESGNIKAVMDGDIDIFIESYLRAKAKNALTAGEITD